MLHIYSIIPIQDKRNTNDAALKNLYHVCRWVKTLEYANTWTATEHVVKSFVDQNNECE